MATRLLLPAIPALLRRVVPRTIDYPAIRFQWPVCLLFMAVIFYAISLIAFSAASRVFWGYVAASVGTIALTWIGLRLIDSAGGLFEGGRRSRIGSGRIAMARFLDKMSKARASLIAFLDSSIEIEIFAHVLETSNDAFLTAQEELLLQIMDIVRANGAKFALPLPAPSLSRDRNTNPQTRIPA